MAGKGPRGFQTRVSRHRGALAQGVAAAVAAAVAVTGVATVALTGCEVRETADPPADGLRPAATSGTFVAGAGGEPTPAIAADTTLDCVERDYPCVWADVALEVMERTQGIAAEGITRFEDGQDASAIAEWLETQPGMGMVLHDEFAVRYWLEGGRPIWLFDPEVAELGLRAASSAAPRVAQQAARRADPVGEQTPGVRPEKSFLHLDPYRWDFRMDVERGVISISDDEAFVIPGLFSRARDFRCTPGKPCACPGNDCVQYVGNTWTGSCDPSSPTCTIDLNVTHEDFRNWDKFDAILVSSHGTEICNPVGSQNCAAAIASGRLLRGDLVTLADAAKASGANYQWADWLTEPGIELFPLGPSPKHCSFQTPGTPGYRYAQCNTGEWVWREYLGLEFFKDAYKSGALKDKLIFLNSCVSMKHKVLANFLAGPNRENAIVGWRDYTPNGAASRAAAVFYREWLKGKTAHEAFLVVDNDPQYSALKPAFAGGRGIVRGDSDRPIVAGAAIHETYGLAEKRGIETVSLFDPATGVDLSDGGRIPLFTQPGDGQSDTLDALIEVIGIDDDEDPAQYVLKVRVDGRDAVTTGRLNIDRGNGTHQYRGSFDLGFDLTPGRAVDVEVSADLPGGGETRWLYYDMVPDACIVPRQGRVAGQIGGPLSRTIDPARRGEFAKIFRSPLGGWGLQMEGRDPGSEANFQIALANAPVAGASEIVRDSGMMGFEIAGGARDPDRVNWFSGDATVSFTAVLPQTGKPFTWVCGTITANLVGIKDPPPGSATPIYVPATFSGRFWAEWYPNG